MGAFRYPVCRHGTLYETNEDLDAATAKAVADEVLRVWGAEDIPAALTAALREAGYDVVSPVVPSGDSGPRIWEGWVARLPPCTCAALSDTGVVYGVGLRMSMVACLRPNRSKVWVRLLLSTIDGHPAEGMHRDAVEAFFNWGNRFCEAVGEQAMLVYSRALRTADASQGGPVRAGTVDIRAVADEAAGLGLVADAIRSGAPLRMSEQFATERAAESLRDFFHLAIHEEVTDYAEYRQLVEGRRSAWSSANEQTTQMHDASVAGSGGLQVFGVSFDHLSALFMRQEQLGSPNEIDCFGMVPAEETWQSDMPASVGASVALMEMISPFI